MEALGWLSFLIVGLLAGWIAEKVMKRDHGIFRNLAVGVVGAYLGAFLFRIVGFEAGGFIAALIVASIGAILLLWTPRRSCPDVAGHSGPEVLRRPTTFISGRRARHRFPHRRHASRAR